MVMKLILGHIFVNATRAYEYHVHIAQEHLQEIILSGDMLQGNIVILVEGSQQNLDLQELCPILFE